MRRRHEPPCGFHLAGAARSIPRDVGPSKFFRFGFVLGFVGELPSSALDARRSPCGSLLLLERKGVMNIQTLPVDLFRPVEHAADTLAIDLTRTNRVRILASKFVPQHTDRLELSAEARHMAKQPDLDEQLR